MWKSPLAGSSRMVRMSSMSIVGRSHLAYDRKINSSRALNVVTGRLAISRQLKRIESIRKADMLEELFESTLNSRRNYDHARPTSGNLQSGFE
jgi:hypothetical protein